MKKIIVVHEKGASGREIRQQSNDHKDWFIGYTMTLFYPSRPILMISIHVSSAMFHVNQQLFKCTRQYWFCKHGIFLMIFDIYRVIKDGNFHMKNYYLWHLQVCVDFSYKNCSSTHASNYMSHKNPWMALTTCLCATLFSILQFSHN